MATGWAVDVLAYLSVEVGWLAALYVKSTRLLATAWPPVPKRNVATDRCPGNYVNAEVSSSAWPPLLVAEFGINADNLSC
jgi:hypothetical protein